MGINIIPIYKRLRWGVEKAISLLQLMKQSPLHLLTMLGGGPYQLLRTVSFGNERDIVNSSVDSTFHERNVDSQQGEGKVP